MILKKITRLVPVLPLALLLLSASAIARDKPDAQLALAKAALDEAQRSYAVQYAPVDYEQARAKLDAAQRAADKRDYDHARRLATEAEADAKVADVRARAAVAEQSVSQVQMSVGTMQQGMPGDPDAVPPRP